MGTVDQAALVELLSLNKSTISRRVSECVRLGYLINEEDRSRHPYRLVLGEAMPGDAVVLPLAEDLR
jgi:DNA-binding IclR family transcriptional regulator